MKQIAQFFTIFWCIYFPTCIAYNDLPGFSSIDELMTGILVIYTFMMRGKRSTTKAPWKEYHIFMGLLIFYVGYSLVLQVNVPMSVIYDLIQQVRPWSVIYCTWILNPQFSNKQKQWMLRTMVLTVITFLFYHPEVADVQSESRNAPFGQLAICTSMSWYLFTKKTKRNRIITAVIAVVGLLGMKFKYYGEFGAWMFMLYYMKGKFKFGRAQMYWQLAVLAFLVILLGWDRFNAYYVEGLNNDEEGMARPLMLKAAWKMLWDYFPFGAGLGTFGTAASAVYYSPLWAKYGLDRIWGIGDFNGVIGFHCDAFFAAFAQIGWVGIYFFVIFWKRRIKQFDAIVDMRYYRVAMMAFFCTFIEWFGDSAFFSGKGMGYLMLMGVCLNANKNMEDSQSEYDDEDSEEYESKPLGLHDSSKLHDTAVAYDN